MLPDLSVVDQRAGSDQPSDLALVQEMRGRGTEATWEAGSLPARQRWCSRKVDSCGYVRVIDLGGRARPAGCTRPGGKWEADRCPMCMQLRLRPVSSPGLESGT